MNTARPDLISCRLASASDAPVLARMSRDYVERGHGWSWQASRIARCVSKTDCVVLCAETRQASSNNVNVAGQAAIAGFAIMEFAERRAHLSLLAVHPRQRRQGIAQTLLDWLTRSAMVAGIEQITLEVRAQNVGARRFYADQGFEEFAHIPRYYSGRENAYRLRKILRESFRAD